MRRQWLTSFIDARASYDLDEAVHVADGLHRAAQALDEPGRAGDEALPAVQARPRRAERERDRLVVVLSEHGALAHGFLALSGTPSSGTETGRSAGSRTRARRCRGRSPAVGLPLSRKSPPTVPVRLRDERVAQARVAVELVDRDRDERVRRQVRRSSRGASRVELGVDRVVGDPGRVRVIAARRPAPSPERAACRLEWWPRRPIPGTLVRYRPMYRPSRTQTIAVAATIPSRASWLSAALHDAGELIAGRGEGKADDGDVICPSFTSHHRAVMLPGRRPERETSDAASWSSRMKPAFAHSWLGRSRPRGSRSTSSPTASEGLCWRSAATTSS